MIMSAICHLVSSAMCSLSVFSKIFALISAAG